MADEDKNKKSGDDPKKKAETPGGFKLPMSTLAVWIAIVGSIIVLAVINQKMKVPVNLITEDEFFQKFEANQIAHGTINYSPQSAYPNATFNDINGTYY